jgi:glutathione S-transferase
MSQIKLVVGNKNYSSWSMRPWLLLKAFGIPFEEINIALYRGDTAEKLGPYSPSLKVPALLHNETTVWESLAICEYISEQLLEGRGWPANPRKRASARSVAAEVHAEFPHLRKDWPMNCKATLTMHASGALADEIARIDGIWSCCRRKHGTGGDYLFGKLSIADCMMAPIAISFRAYGAKLSLEAQRYCNTLLANLHVQDWVKAGRAEIEPTSMKVLSSLAG